MRKVIKGKTYDTAVSINCKRVSDWYDFIGYPVQRHQTMYQRPKSGDYFIHYLTHKFDKTREHIIDTYQTIIPVTDEQFWAWVDGKAKVLPGIGVVEI